MAAVGRRYLEQSDWSSNLPSHLGENLCFSVIIDLFHGDQEKQATEFKISQDLWQV